MNTRAKFKCTSVLLTDKDGGGDVTLEPVTTGSKENESFFRWTPYGKFTMGLVSGETVKNFIPGMSYYIDISPAPND